MDGHSASHRSRGQVAMAAAGPGRRSLRIRTRNLAGRDRQPRGSGERHPVPALPHPRGSARRVLPGPDPPLARRCAHLAGYRVARVGPPRVDAPIRRLGRRTTRHPRGPGVLPSPLKSLAVLLGGAKRPAASRGNHGSGPPQQIRCLLRHRPGGPSGRQESERRPPSGTGADLTGELLGQPLVSEVDLDSLAGVPAELLGDALTADGAAV